MERRAAGKLSGGCPVATELDSLWKQGRWNRQTTGTRGANYRWAAPLQGQPGRPEPEEVLNPAGLGW